jgi:hypothetical protein
MVPAGPATPGARPEAPTLRRIVDRLVFVAPLRFALAAFCAALAWVAGSTPSVLLVSFALGCIGFAGVVLTDRRAVLLGQRARLAAPDDACYARRWATAVSACFPSSVGLTVLALVALVVNATLTALLAGGIAGLGLAGLVAGLQLGLRERAEGVELYVAAGSNQIYERSSSRSPPPAKRARLGRRYEWWRRLNGTKPTSR